MSPSSSVIFFSFSTLSFGSPGIFKACFQGLRWAYLPSVSLGVSFCWYFSLNSHIHYMVARMFMLEVTFESHVWIGETAFYPRFCKRFCFVSNWSKLLLPSSSGSFPYFLRHAHLNSPPKMSWVFICHPQYIKVLQGSPSGWTVANEEYQLQHG